VNELLSVRVFVGFGIMPLVCASIIWTLLGPISPLSSGLDFTVAS
jgi:preprotein translocase subunit SecY